MPGDRKMRFQIYRYDPDADDAAYMQSVDCADVSPKGLSPGNAIGEIRTMLLTRTI
jgi:succinate dehydrogenase/fumarate reductase-like Fe-S protein